MGGWGKSNRFDGVGEAGGHGSGRRGRLRFFNGLLRRLAMRMAQTRLLCVDSCHVACTRQAGLGHGSHFAGLGTDRAGVACHSQLHEQQAEQREEHCDQAMAARTKH